MQHRSVVTGKVSDLFNFGVRVQSILRNALKQSGLRLDLCDCFREKAILPQEDVLSHSEKLFYIRNFPFPLSRIVFL